MKNRICLVIPYFGKLPSYVDLFFKSLEQNDNLDAVLITDCNVGKHPDNLKVVNISFDQLREKIQSNFDFKINLEFPYKLCDFKPAYGLIFSDYLRDYEFWGYCDLDIILGDTKLFLTNEVLDKYDKFYQHGHLGIYKNTSKVNNEFMSSYGMNYKKVFSSSVIFVFDEIPGVQQKFDHDGFKTYKGWDFFDVCPWKYHLTRVTSYVPENILNKDFDFKHECFYWKDGHIYRDALVDEKILKSEFIYCHFQKRNYKVSSSVLSSNEFYLMNEGCKKKEADTSANEIDLYNSFSDIKEKEYRKKEKSYIWHRRINKYIFHRGGVTAAVLLSSYNGADYIKDQINSLLNQDGEIDLFIFVRDDGSTDGTQEILNDFQSNGYLSWYQGENVGPAKSFLELLSKAKGFDYYLFCDQDDYWLPFKVDRAIKQLPKEGIYTYFSNAEVVDSQLHSLGKTVYSVPPKLDFKTFTCAGGILGCTTAINSTVAQLIQNKPLPSKIYMHDFYIHEVCLALNGKIFYDSSATMLYRQHGDNTIGVSVSHLNAIKNIWKSLTTKSKISIADQAKSILELYQAEMNDENAKWLTNISEYRISFFRRCKLALSNSIKYNTWHSGIVMRCIIFLGNR